MERRKHKCGSRTTLSNYIYVIGTVSFTKFPPCQMSPKGDELSGHLVENITGDWSDG